MTARTFPTTTAAAVAVLVNLTACGAADQSEAPTMEPSTRPLSCLTATELAATGEPLDAGHYTRSGFEPRITIQLDGSWQAVQLASGFFDIQQDVGSPDVIAVQFARPTGIFGATGSEDVTGAEAAVEALRANPGLVIVESSGSRIGGLEGSQVTVENAGEAHASVLSVPPGTLGIDPGRRLWIAFFEVPDGLLAVMVGGSVATWDEALGAAEPVLESVQVGP